jgi:hypothetical protein
MTPAWNQFCILSPWRRNRLPDCLKLEKNIINDVRSEMTYVRHAVKWAAHLPK